MNTNTFGKLLIQKKSFIGMVYFILASQLFITFFVTKYLRNHQDIYHFSIKFFIPLIIIPFIIIFVIPYCSTIVQFLLFCLFSFILGILSIGASTYVSNEIIEVALISSMGVFISMSLIGVIIASMGIDLSFTMFMMCILLVGLLTVRIVLLFVPVSSQVYANIATISIILFSLFVGIDTNRMLQKNYNLSAVETAMTFYLDIENLFSNFIEIGLNQGS